MTALSKKSKVLGTGKKLTSNNLDIASPTEPETPNKRVLYPVFAECAQFTLDPYWQQVFDECAKGKFPRNSGIDSEGKTVYFRKNNTKSYTSYTLKENPEEVFKDLKKLFQDQLHFKSKRDRQELRAELDVICKDLQETYTGSWQTIKRKKIKDPIIRRYILDLKEEYNLNDVETAEVAQIIKLGFLFNWIASDEVDYQDQQIMNIKTLHFDAEERSFELEEPDVKYKREYKPKPNKLSTLWSKYLKNPTNKYML